VAHLFLGSLAINAGWILLLALLAGLVLALRAWWTELGEVDKLRSQTSTSLKKFKRGAGQ
jgi:hypothetical protein